MSTKYKAYKALTTPYRREPFALYRDSHPQEKAMDETAIAAALETAAAPRYEGDAAQLCAIAKHANMDGPMLTWWIRTPASRARDWSALSLRNWTLKYSGLLSHITTGSNLQMCEQCQAHPARLMAGVWICSGGCAPVPARPPAGPA
jgi:hypothetical protein